MKPPEDPAAPSAVTLSAGSRLLKDRVAVVTGAGAGIGRGISRALAYHGATVVAADINGDGARGTVSQIEADGSPPAYDVTVDVRDPLDVEYLVQAAASASSDAVSILVNNVGDFRPNGAFIHTAEEEWSALYRINLEHVFRVTRLFLPIMVARKRGSIINVASVEAFRGNPNNAVYAAFKAGIVNFSRSVAVEVANDGVRMNCIAPDTTHTEQIPVYDWTNEKYRSEIGKWMPLGRFARPDDHGDVAVFLASDLSKFVTGQTINVDGGTMAAAGWYRRNRDEFTNQPRGLR